MERIDHRQAGNGACVLRSRPRHHPRHNGDGPGQTYNVLKAGGNDVGGCMEPPMPGVPNHWHVYFAVDDADATAAQATEQGGQVIVEPFDIPSVGRSALLADPQGAMFSVLKPAPQQ